MVQEFATLAREARMASAVRLREVADALGVSIAYISEVERGLRPPPPREKATRWAAAVHADVIAFIDASIADRAVVELSTNVPAHQREVAYALARAYDGISPEQASAIKRILTGD